MASPAVCIHVVLVQCVHLHIYTSCIVHRVMHYLPIMSSRPKRCQLGSEATLFRKHAFCLDGDLFIEYLWSNWLAHSLCITVKSTIKG